MDMMMKDDTAVIRLRKEHRNTMVQARTGRALNWVSGMIGLGVLATVVILVVLYAGPVIAPIFQSTATFR